MFKFLFGLLDNISGSLKVLQAFNSPILSQSITAADHTITTMKLNEKIMLVESKIGVMQKSYSMRNDAAYVDLLLLKQQKEVFVRIFCTHMDTLLHVYLYPTLIFIAVMH
ncbi:hypothetical protein X798_03355 [Onchocerca flexuosa]|uniref:Uncharacterized protein n=1 Tax=Onchocerca flexuosa TaxID=387005 RepID=A0A238BWG2_9BILA|nr:hypothetical protein X798_03355 [Onchocerca flexuosa]